MRNISPPPPHESSQRTQKQYINYKMHQLNAWGFRDVYDFDCKEQTEFYYIIQDKFLPISDLPTKTRNLVRKANKNLDFRKISYTEIVASGYDIYVAAYKSYKDHTLFRLPTEDEYKTNIINHKDRDYWGVYNKENELIAYAINIIHDKVVEYSSMKAEPTFNKLYAPYYGLIYSMNKFYLCDKGCLYVTDGARSITEHSNIQYFLCHKFMFRKAYCKMEMHYVWWLRLGINMLYPFRKIVPIRILKVLLRQEEWSRKSH